MPDQDRISIADDDLHVGALAIGAGIGTVLAALLVGSVMLLLVLAFGAVAGAVIAAMVSAVLDRRHRATAKAGSPDFPPPSLTAGSSPADERREAGHASPTPA